MRNLFVRPGAALRASLLLSTVCTPVFAQVATTQAPAAKQADSGKLETVVVTAQRREQRLQDVPLAVTVLSGKQLAQQQVTSTQELIRMVPNMVGGNNVGQGSANVYYIRGLGQTQSFSTFEPQVGTYVNDIYLSRQNANNFALFDVQDIQVLRGPQGTLFGRNSTGGAISVTLTPPSDKFGGYAELGGGGRDRVTGRFGVDLPISDQILTKFAAYGLDDDGYGKNVITDKKVNARKDWGVREAVRLKPTSDITWDLSVDYSDSNQANILTTLQPNGDRISYSGFLPNGNTVGLLTGKIANLGQGADVLSWGGASNIKWQTDYGTLSIISGYRGLKQTSAIDFPDAQFGPLVPYDEAKVGQFALAELVDGDEYTQEVKWNGTVGSTINYTTGLYYLYETNETNFGAAGNLGYLLDGIYNFPVGFPLNAPFGQEVSRNTTSSLAGYAQADYKIGEGLTATAGVRYTLERKTVNIISGAPGGFDTADVVAAGYETVLKSDVITPHFALQYQFDPSLNVYASATKGFQGGGWNGLAFASSPPAPIAAAYNNFGPEKVWSYEAGGHFNDPDGKFNLNANVFLEEVSNYQLLSISLEAGQFLTQNAANLQAYGFEASFNWRPEPDLTLSGALGIENGSYNSPSAAVQSQIKSCLASGSGCQNGIVTAAGTLAAPADLPPVTATLNGAYILHYTGFTVTPNIGVQVIGRHNDDPSGNPGGLDPTFALFDAGVAFHLDNAPWTITAECRNCGMENYGVSYLFGHKYYNDPGIWDLRLNYKF